MDVLYFHGGLRFVWDQAKALSNVRKHGLTFEMAAQVLLDPLLKIEDAADGYESRQAAIGVTAVDQLLYVVYLEHYEDGIRIISARRPTIKERRRYEDNA